MRSLNKALLIGHLGKDPKLATLTSGDRVATFSLATSDSWKDKTTGERRERTEWHQVVIFNDGLAKVAAEYAKKGSLVFVEGELRTRKWTDQSGVEKYTTEVVLTKFRGDFSILEKREHAPPNEGDYGTTRTSTPAAANFGAAPRPADLDDDIPF